LYKNLQKAFQKPLYKLVFTIVKYIYNCNCKRE